MIRDVAPARMPAFLGLDVPEAVPSEARLSLDRQIEAIRLRQGVGQGLAELHLCGMPCLLGSKLAADYVAPIRARPEIRPVAEILSSCRIHEAVPASYRLVIEQAGPGRAGPGLEVAVAVAPGPTGLAALVAPGVPLGTGLHKLVRAVDRALDTVRHQGLGDGLGTGAKDVALAAPS